MSKIQESADGGNAYALGDYSYAEGGAAGESLRGIGGDGGNAHAIGAFSVAVGGQGGHGGVGKGGPGGDAVALQDGAVCYGGQGGESNKHDGRGGRGGVSPMMQMIAGPEFARRASMKPPYGSPNTFPGRGGDTPDTPQYMARRLIVEQVKTSYFVKRGVPTEGAMRSSCTLSGMQEEWQRVLTAKGSDVWYDRTFVPLTWINLQVRQGGNLWTVSVEAEEYVFTDEC